MIGSTPAVKLCTPIQWSGVMNFYIKEWTDNTATLMTECGRVVWTFASGEETGEAARDHGQTRYHQNRVVGTKMLGIRATTDRSCEQPPMSSYRAMPA